MLKIFSPAKINLFLRVVGKRPDGYHELSSLFQAIDLGDTLSIELQDFDSLTCTDPGIPTDNSNLVLKAAQLFRRKTGLKTGLKIHLEKRIPIQAGLGGGSSNAATILWAFNQLAGNIVSEQELQTWAGEIGSDIAFFFSKGTAHCTGRGEIVTPLAPLSKSLCWIVKPNLGLSTPEVYRKFKLIKDLSHTYICKEPSSFLSESLHYVNDLESPAFEIRPELKELKNQLLECGFNTVLLTGSGSAFFCLGVGTPPISPHLTSFSASFINRLPNSWYQKHEF